MRPHCRDRDRLLIYGDAEPDELLADMEGEPCGADVIEMAVKLAQDAAGGIRPRKSDNCV
jgi:hypothetical protein